MPSAPAAALLALVAMASAARAQEPVPAPAPIAPRIIRVPEPAEPPVLTPAPAAAPSIAPAPAPAPQAPVVAPAPLPVPPLHAPSQAVTAAPAPAPLPAPAPFDPQHYTLRVHLLDAPKAELRGTASGEQIVCPAPCGRELHLRPTDQFTIAGEGIDESDAFPFIPRNGEVKLHVNAGSSARGLGRGLILGGTLGIGLGYLLTISTVSTSPLLCEGSCSTPTGLKVAGALELAGLAAIAIGAITVLANPATTHWSE